MKQFKPIELKSITYTGPSMNPTLKGGDRLHVIPYDGRRIRPGDVILFLPPEGDHQITHRVVSVDSQGIRTRGDSSSHVDPWVLSPDHILGRVVSAKRGNRRRRIPGGHIGRVFVRAVSAIHVVDSSVSCLLRPSYHRLARSGLFRRWLHGWIKTRILSFTRPEGEESQLLLGRRVIGRRLPGQVQWHIRRPFRLFVDEASLPDSPSEAAHRS